MFVLEVIPFSRTAPPAPLSYRSRTDLPVGTLVSIPLRKKVVSGLVIGSMPVQEAKAALKTASFSLSKSTDVAQGQIPSELIEAAQNVATYHATTLGAVLLALLIPVLPEEFPKKLEKGSIKKLFQKSDPETVEASFIARRDQYEKWIQESAKKEKVALLVVPTQAEADEWGTLLKKYKPLVISGRLTGERREAALARAPLAHEFTPLVITTPSFAWMPVIHLERIIIERMSAGSYALPKRPYLDYRYAVTELARARQIPIAYGDYPLPLEYRKDPLVPLETGLVGSAEIFDARTDKTVKKDVEAFKAIPDYLRDQIRTALEPGGRVSVLAVRRGYSPTVVCKDCGTAVTDEHGRALSLATVNGKRVFRSNDGKVLESAEVFCKVCGGWNLMPLGVGVERVEEELHEAFPETSIVRIDQDTKSVASLKKARVQIAEPGTIIIGTELMLPFLSPYEPVELGIIASADSLLALPFWRARERFVRISMMLAERTKHLVIATRHPEDAAFSPEFWEEETNLRKILNYPPFGTLIVFHTEGTVARLAEARAAIKAACAPYIPHELPDRPLPGTEQFKTSLVLQLPLNVWPDKVLSNRLAGLSPAIRIHIDSETLW
jgi:primosomal protein N'